jgi:hypothetical protein
MANLSNFRLYFYFYTGHPTFYRPTFPCRLRVYWAITASLLFLIIVFFMVRHFLFAQPLQLTTSPEAMFPSALGLNCGNATNATIEDAKVL